MLRKLAYAWLLRIIWLKADFAVKLTIRLVAFDFQLFAILVPRGRAPFGQHQESRPLAWSNTGSPRITDFPSLYVCSESSLTNLIGSGLNLLCFQSHSKMECHWIGPEVAILGAGMLVKKGQNIKIINLHDKTVIYTLRFVFIKYLRQYAHSYWSIGVFR